MLTWPTVRLQALAAKAACALFAGGALTIGLAVDAAPVQKLRIVGGLATLNQYTRQEEPFWTRELARLSGGKFEAEIVPFDRAGVPGNDMLRLIQLGVVPFGTALLSNISAQHPEYGAPDLAGLNPDIASLKKSVTAFRPYLENALRTRHGIELLAVYVYPAQVVFCKKPLTQLADLAGRRVRVSSPTQSDFVSGLGGAPVLVGFGQLMSSMASGNTECAITAAMSGNTLGLHEVTSHIHTMPVNWGMAVFGVNISAWTELNPELRSLLSREIPKLEAAIWQDSERETTEGLQCNTGAQGCNNGRKGRMVQVTITAQDERQRRDIFNGTVLKNWLQRCGPPCREVWNQSVGKTSPVATSATPATPALKPGTAGSK
jgi:TRAP-type C4-dicarboxylate transport system substrate-binding protein